MLAAASNAGVYEKIAILDEYAVDHCWIVTRDHHLDGPLAYSLYHLSVTNTHAWHRRHA